MEFSVLNGASFISVFRGQINIGFWVSTSDEKKGFVKGAVIRHQIEAFNAKFPHIPPYTVEKISCDASAAVCFLDKQRAYIGAQVPAFMKVIFDDARSGDDIVILIHKYIPLGNGSSVCSGASDAFAVQIRGNIPFAAEPEGGFFMQGRACSQKFQFQAACHGFFRRCIDNAVSSVPSHSHTAGPTKRREACGAETGSGWQAFSTVKRARTLRLVSSWSASRLRSSRCRCHGGAV